MIPQIAPCLRDCGLVDYRIEGRQSFYSLSRPELMELLTAAEVLLCRDRIPEEREQCDDCALPTDAGVNTAEDSCGQKA